MRGCFAVGGCFALCLLRRGCLVWLDVYEVRSSRGMAGARFFRGKAGPKLPTVITREFATITLYRTVKAFGPVVAISAESTLILGTLPFSSMSELCRRSVFLI